MEHKKIQRGEQLHKQRACTGVGELTGSSMQLSFPLHRDQRIPHRISKSHALMPMTSAKHETKSEIGERKMCSTLKAERIGIHLTLA